MENTASPLSSPVGWLISLYKGSLAVSCKHCTSGWIPLEQLCVRWQQQRQGHRAQGTSLSAALTANSTSATWHRESYLPLGNGGKATDFNFLSSAAVKQFLTVSSSCSSHLSEPHCGMWQWMTNFAARPLDWVSAANTNENITFSLEQKPPCNDLSTQSTFLITSPLHRNTLGLKYTKMAHLQ